MDQDPILVKVGGKELNIRSALPLTVGDWKALEKKGLSRQRLAEGSITDAAEVFHYLVRKVDPSITMPEIDTMSANDPAFEVVGKAMKEIDRPFSG